MRRKKRTQIWIYLLFFLIALLLFAASMLVMYFRLAETDSKKSAELADSKNLIEEQQRQLAEYEDELSDKLRNISALRESADGLMGQIEELNKTVDLLRDERTAESAALSEYNTMLESVKQQLYEKTDELQRTLVLLEDYQSLVRNNHSYSSDKITELFTLLEDEVPYIFIENENFVETELNEDLEQKGAYDSADDIASKEASALEKYIPVKANIAYYYEDLATNYTISYNENEVMYSASLIKAPYIYCILEEISQFEKNKREYSSDGEKLYDEEGNPIFEGKHPNLNDDGSIIYGEGEEKYDLSRKWTYNSATMYKEGSGEIQFMDDGTVMTYRELVEYALLYSDNVAFAELRSLFGMDSFNKKVSELNIAGTASGFMNLSARDCGKFMREIYKFFETDSEYAALMKDCMTRSKHTVMIVSALYGKTSAHKYGWDIDAYHDMAVVFDEHPYIIVIMTNMDSGGEEANSFVRRLTQLTDEIHTSHYK